jgi:hypothetical protein
LSLFVFCHTTVVFVKLLPARAKKKFNKAVISWQGRRKSTITICLLPHDSRLCPL